MRASAVDLSDEEVVKVEIKLEAIARGVDLLLEFCDASLVIVARLRFE